MDVFDRLPDPLIILIFNFVSDVKTLILCRSISKRFNSLVPQTDSLLLKVDRVISPDTDSDHFDSSLFTFFKSIIKSLYDLVSPQPLRSPSQNSPAQMLRQFERIRNLEIELPSGYLKMEKGAAVKWKAEFGEKLKSCVILGFRSIKDSQATAISDDGGDVEFVESLKTRVVWTISALIAASARHFLLKEVVRQQKELERLVLRDREGEGTVVMEKGGLEECREREAHVSEEEESRTRVPSVRMRMRHARRLEVRDGVWVDATLVVVRSNGRDTDDGSQLGSGDVEGRVREDEDGELAVGTFEGVYREAVHALLKGGRSYTLEMNSF